jgi:hypothetical protein
MLVVSVSSDIYSVISNDGTETAYIVNVNTITKAEKETAVYNNPYPIHQAESHDLTAVAAEVTTTSPFGDI